MIFVTVGHQMPFDRMVRAVDEWAFRCGRQDVFAQIGDGEYLPRHLGWQRFMSPEEFNKRIDEASAVVAHAGTGTIITAVELGKSVLVLPRRSALNETRNDHQIATAQRFSERGYVLAADDERDFKRKLDECERFRPSRLISGQASLELLTTLRAFVFNAPLPFEMPHASRAGQFDHPPMTPLQPARAAPRS